MIRPSSIYEDYLRQPAKPDVPATVLIVSPQGTVDVQLASGEVLRRVDLAGAASAGDRVMLRYDDHGNYTALGSRPASAVSGAAFVTATGSSGSGSGTIPDPHDLLGTHHTLPTVSAGQVFAAPASSSGTPSFRAISTTDLPTLTVSAGNGLTGGGALPSVTLNVGAGNGITVDASSVSVQRAATSGLSFSGTGLQIDDSIAGAGLTIAGKVMKLADGVAGAGLSINTSTKVLSVSAGDGISVASSPSAVAVDSSVARSSWKVNAGAGLAVTNSGNLSSSGPTFSVSLAATSGLNTTSGLAVGAGAGISVLTSTVAVDTGYAFTWSAAHTFSARPTFSLGATIAAGQTLRIGSGTGDVDLSRKASDVLALGSGDAMESTSYQSGVSGWRIGAAGNAEFGNVRIRGELASTVFRFNEVSATAGTLGVYYSASTVDADFTTPAATNSTVSAQIKNSTPTSTTALFASGDRLQVRVWNGTSLATAWFTVDAAPTTATGYSTYSLRLQSGSTSALIPAGTAIVDWGTASSGGAVALSSDGTIGAAPNISVLTTAGSPWSDQTLRARLGNLNGSYGYAADTFGFAAGNSATTFLAVDSTNGFRVVRDTTTRFQVDTAGALTIRNTAGAAVITMDSTSARIDNVLNIGTSGEIRQGTGSLTASPATFTGTRMWNDSGVGRIGGYNSGTLQWYAGTDGKLYAGGGDVSLSANGVLIDTSGIPGNPVQKQIYGFVPYNPSTGLPISGAYAGLSYYQYSKLYIESSLVLLHDTAASGSASYIYIAAKASSGTVSQISLDAAATVVTGGLNVGTIGAGTGAIKAAAGISGTTGTFSSSLSATSGAFTGNVSVTVASSPTLTISSTASGGGSRSFFKMESQNNSDYFLAGYFADAFPKRMQWHYNSDGSAGAVPVLSMTSTNRVGVNVGAPGYTLDVAGDIRATGGLNVNTTGAAAGEIKAGAGTFSSTITGTGTFQSQLVIGAINNAGSVSFNRGSNGATTAWIGFATATDAANFEFRQNGGGAYYTWALNNGTAIVEAMRLTSAGRLGIGANNPGYLLDVAGDVNSTGVYRVSGTQVVGARKTGWAAATGTATRTTFATSTVTTAQLAERVKALVDDLISHGLIGA